MRRRLGSARTSNATVTRLVLLISYITVKASPSLLPFLLLGAHDRHEAGRELLVTESRPALGVDPVFGEQGRDLGRVDQGVLVALVIAAPRAVVVAEEDSHIPDVHVRFGTRVLGGDDPVVAPAHTGLDVGPGLSPLEVLDVDGV